MYNNGCCTPPSPRRENCCCKDGIICALDWFFQDFLLKENTCIKTGSLMYYPRLSPVQVLPQQNINPTQEPISNIIYNIPFITQEIVPVYITEQKSGSYIGDITYLNICKLHGFQFELNDDCKRSKESDIISRFSKIKYSSPNNCCCKNGILEFLLKARDFLTNPCSDPVDSNASVILSTSDNSFRITQILAINSDTVWAKNEIPKLGSSPAKTIYYVLSLCEIIGITLDRSYKSVTEDQNNEDVL